jgi:hypothetical protein
VEINPRTGNAAFILSLMYCTGTMIVLQERKSHDTQIEIGGVQALLPQKKSQNR